MLNQPTQTQRYGVYGFTAGLLTIVLLVLVLR
jgi:hypothetical protein